MTREIFKHVFVSLSQTCIQRGVSAIQYWVNQHRAAAVTARWWYLHAGLMLDCWIKTIFCADHFLPLRTRSHFCAPASSSQCCVSFYLPNFSVNSNISERINELNIRIEFRAKINIKIRHYINVIYYLISWFFLMKLIIMYLRLFWWKGCCANDCSSFAFVFHFIKNNCGSIFTLNSYAAVCFGNVFPPDLFYYFC